MKTYRIFVRDGFGGSLGNMIDALSADTSVEADCAWIIVEEREVGHFVVTDDSMTDKNGDWIIDAVALGFAEWDAEVEDLDDGYSDESQCFGMSNHLRWNDVVLRPDEFHAPSIERLAEAITHVTMCAWCPGDI